MRVFFYLFAFISTWLPATKSRGPHPSWDSEKKLNLSVFTSSKQRRKSKFYVVFVQVVKKSAMHVQNWARFLWRSHYRRLCRCSKDLSMCVNGWKSEHVFSKNACHLFTRSICHSRFSSLMKNNFVSLETDNWVERKKSPLFKKKCTFQRNNPAESWMNWGKLWS